MTKEALKQEAHDWVEANTKVESCPPWGDVKVTPSSDKAYIAGAESREKQIEIDAEQIRALQKQNGELTDKVTELEEQIKKMKCCQNCDNWNWKHNKCEKKLKGDCFKQSKWVMRNI